MNYTRKWEEGNLDNKFINSEVGTPGMDVVGSGGAVFSSRTGVPKKVTGNPLSQRVPTNGRPYQGATTSPLDTKKPVKRFSNTYCRQETRSDPVSHKTPGRRRTSRRIGSEPHESSIAPVKGYVKELNSLVAFESGPPN